MNSDTFYNIIIINNILISLYEKGNAEARIVFVSLGFLLIIFLLMI